MTPPDRLVGALCLVVAAVALTWGPGPAEESESRVLGRAELKVSAGGETDGDPAAAPPTTAPAPDTTTSTAKGTPGSTPTSATAPTTTTAPASKEADEALARRAVLAQGDLPGGFVVVRPAPS
ncbi:MAG: hypothetical protein ACRDYV_09300, partial [Acidimicrobiia bacterium]